ncbi:NusA antitermination factor [Bowdeniella nasicola]|uniref:Transcription termination/antitermination protein NusA n=1 Tax=Bowdeniella nasicola TaxID=208480 RepID=A0A1H4CYU5_9ACTO|nr:transcription termination factor NusA [Bowdeniella nasicola]SEA65663.1 NusA antitermination factor [Bowdeniella nasicola]
MDIDMSALKLVGSELEISLDVLISAIEEALLTAYHHLPDSVRGARIDIDRRTGAVTVWAPEYDDEGTIIGEFEHTPEGFGRIAAQTARSVIVQRLRDAEDQQVLGNYKDKAGQLVSGVVQHDHRTRHISIDLGDVEAILPEHEQVPGETYEHGERLRAYVVEVGRGRKGPQIIVSRTHPEFVRGLFAHECPEVAKGDVTITSIAREAGRRSKIAVRSNVAGLNAKGACIGPMGQRARAVMSELRNEKIDIVDYSDDPAEFVAAALSPAKVSQVIIDEEAHRAIAIVPDYQLSLAIGKEGQNARLAHRLTGWKLDIRSDAEPSGQ